MAAPSTSRRFPSTVLPALLGIALAPLARGQVFDYRVAGGSTDLAFGGAISRIGDVDQDGCDDLVVGAPDSGASAGAVTILSGKTGAVLAHLDGTTSSQLGFAVDGKLDADGDGFPDVLIGAPGDSTSASMGGGVMIYSPHLNLTLVNIHSSTSNALLGYSVRTLEADLDGDGIDDFVAGASVAHSAYVYSGRTGALIFAESGQSGSLFGASVSLGGKLDGDNVVDFVVGSPLYLNSGGKKTGRVVAFSGKDGSQLWAVNGAADSHFGQSLAHPGDLDGDGHGDLVVGAPFHLDANGVNKTGCATVLSGATGAVLYKVFGDQTGDEFGDSVRSVGGDLDGDGTNDFVVGAPQLSGAQRGYARVISGATGATIFTLGEHGDPNGINFYGYAVAGGDFDGDGRTDVVVGGVAYNGGQGNIETWTTAVARWSNYDTGYPGTLGVPTFTARNDPVVGQHLDLDLSNSLGATTAGLLVIGTSQVSIPTGRGGRLLVDPLLFLLVSVPAAGLTLSGSVPNDPALYGFDLDLQAIEIDPGAPLGLSFTPGLDVTFGYP